MDDKENQTLPPEVTKVLKENRSHRYRNIIHLWEFLLELLADERYNSIIAWSRKEEGEFKLKNAAEVAKRWGAFKNKSDMNYDKLSRAIRCYYRQGIIKKVNYCSRTNNRAFFILLCFFVTSASFCLEPW